MQYDSSIRVASLFVEKACFFVVLQYLMGAVSGFRCDSFPRLGMTFESRKVSLILTLEVYD
jgi:hypothetical protein